MSVPLKTASRCFINCNLASRYMSPRRGDSALRAHGGAAAYGFPRGEAGMKRRSSQRLFMTDEEWRNISILFAKTVKRLGNKDFLLCLLIYTAFFSYCIAIPLPTSLRSATFPPGEGIGAPAPVRQTTIYPSSYKKGTLTRAFSYFTINALGTGRSDWLKSGFRSEISKKRVLFSRI